MRAAIVAIFLSLAGVTAATADEAAAAERPWATGVSAADQERALELFRRGNQRFERSDYAAAADWYRQALDAWDHPAVHGNLAVALVHLDQPLVAVEHFDLALRWGSAPFAEHVYEQLVTSRKLLRGQLARIAVVCKADGAEVNLDGAAMFTCPGQVEHWALAGSHDLVARKPGYLSFTRRFDAFPGEVTHIDVSLIPLSEAGGYERRWAEWKPWAVLGAGASLSLAGVGLLLSAESSMDAFDDEIARSCPDGCDRNSLPTAVRDLESNATLKSRLAASAFVVGSAALVSGGILLYLNRPHRVMVDADGRRLSIVPHLGPDLAGVTLRLGF